MPSKSLSASVVSHYSTCAQERKEPLAHIFIGHKLMFNLNHWPNQLHGKAHLSTCLWEKTWDAHEPFEKGHGAAFFFFFISGLDERNASRSVSTCVTKHACLQLTGWKRLSRMAPFHSDTQLRPNWFEVHNRHAARQHPRLLSTCPSFSDSPLWKNIPLICVKLK